MSAERTALNNLRKQKWERGHAQLRKSLQKDSANATAKYVMALYFFMPKNPAFQIDSAHQYALQTMMDFRKANIKQREKMKKFPLDSVIIITLYQQLDSAAFEEAKSINTENAYLHYLGTFPKALHETQAIELRDEAAYLDALKQNIYQSFASFLQRYPQAHQAGEAQRRYDKLLFEAKTKDKKLKSYENFLTEYPASPYRNEVEKNIFEISTAAGDGNVFDAFVKKYSQSAYAHKAKDILYHILIENEHHEVLPTYLDNDSIKFVETLRKGYLVPFLKDGKFGFMDVHGKEVIEPQAEDIDKQYLCGNITEDVLVIDDKIISRNGKVIYHGHVDDLDDIGFGFLTLSNDKGITILHKTGFTIPETAVQDVKMLSGKFIALKRNNRWALWTLAGRKIVNYDWDDITCIVDVIVFKKQGKCKLLKAFEVGQLANQQPFKNQDFFDDVKQLKQNLIWARTGEFEGILDQNLNATVPFEKHILSTADCGIISTTAYGKKIYNLKNNTAGVFENVKANEQWTAVRQTSSWRLFNAQNYHYQSAAFDSIGFIGPFAIGYDYDSMTVYLNPNHSIQFLRARVEFLPSKDSLSYLIVEEGDKKNVFTNEGVKLFTVVYDKIAFAGNGIFIVSKKEKKGLIGSDGKLLLPLEFDAIGGVNNKVVSVLKSMKFGLYDVSQKVLIKPQFDKNIGRYNSKVLTAFKDGLFGFIGWDGKPITKFEFNEIMFWNDTTALVKKDLQWMLYHTATQRVLMSNIKDFKILLTSSDEKIAIVHQDNNYGVLSNRKGVIIPVNFTYVKNVGAVEQPMYFTEKHIEEASIYVAIYYDKKGELLRKQVYEEDDYEKIYCAD
jgi:hypothetical protein